MAGYAICPYCKATVQPWTDTGGRKVCPLCGNTGKPVAPSAPLPAPSLPPGPAAVPAGRPYAPGAVASLVCGIVGVVTGFGIVLGFVAIVLAGKARRAIAAKPGAYEGESMATVGKVLGIVGIILTFLLIAMAAVVFVLVSNLVPPDVEFLAVDQGFGGFIEVTSTDDGVDWDELRVSTDADCVVPTGSVDEGDRITCSGDGPVTIKHRATGKVLFRGEV